MPLPAVRSPTASSCTTPTTVAGTHPSNSQHACGEREFRLPWARSGTRSTTPSRRPLFEYIDGFYNPRRIQKRLGYLSPIEFEEKHYANQAAAVQVNLKLRQPALTS
jgi:hypothetical protein